MAKRTTLPGIGTKLGLPKALPIAEANSEFVHGFGDTMLTGPLISGLSIKKTMAFTKSRSEIQDSICRPVPCRPPRKILKGFAVVTRAPPSDARTTPILRFATLTSASDAAAVAASHFSTSP